MKRLHWLGLVMMAASAMAAADDSGLSLEEGFRNPPNTAKPHLWWHWMNGNVTKEGITADLEAMAEVGIGGAQKFEFDASFRQKNGEVTLWDAVTGERTAPQSDFRDGRASVRLALPEFGSVFVVFGAEAKGLLPAQPELSVIATAGGPWRVEFDPAWGGPEKPVEMETLADWTTFNEPGVKYYSGSAVYRTRLELPADNSSKRRWLDLGRLGSGNVAEVFASGKSLGIVWTAPYRVEITGAAGDISVKVTNQWPNRLIYDSSLPANQRLTKTNITSIP